MVKCLKWHADLQVMSQPRAVEMEFPLWCTYSCTFYISDKPGTIIREDYTVEANKHMNYWRSWWYKYSKSSPCGVENKPGVDCIQNDRWNVDVNMIVQSIRSVGETKNDLIFTVAMDDVVLTKVLENYKNGRYCEAVNIDEKWRKFPLLVQVC